MPAGGGSSGVDGFAAQDTRGGGGGPRERRSGQTGGHSRGDTRGEGLAENESVQAPHQTKSGHSNSSEFSEHANWSSAGSAPAPAHPGSHGQGRGRGGGGGSYRGGSRFGQPSGAVSSGNNEAVRPQHQANGVASVHQ
ncbi:unnamed protein product [Protopolystoma xenopodis]|uniref:Uncharacterized protein n=1 Tax=Protopolystoma xenopodis TaxID=117903 RepID=A0A448WNI5_9PLAT|nr:unnamed protein product [Protopolystoma xenopodis]